ncbi:molecular chaperone HtpG [Oleispirillum naphthae]|uniref:molecular chaperone HtpG n=1 Tax=Oleispirillum naphthae TaxID=2838853 RepID=UPI00308239F9
MTVETLHFQAEVSKLLDIVVHALYSQKDIFLRELISNASDACDRLRYAAITEPALAEGDAAFKVRLVSDEAAGLLTIADNGIGMNRAELIENLGTIAHSGTRRFAEALAAQNGKPDAKKALSLIGQFGVGFYSAFMVADRVDVISRKAGETEGWKWSSDGAGDFTVEPFDGAPRGTRIVLTLKDDAKEYLKPEALRRIVKTYSDHIDLPVVLADGEKEETVNTASALWARPKCEVTPEQYAEFYHHVGHAFDDPWLTVHMHAEGAIEYSGLVFVPTERPFDLFDPDRKQRLKLYVRRVFITDDCEGLVPSYLRFLKGVVDTPDLPLNVSRETLQDNPLVRKIGRGLVSRVLAEIGKTAEDKEKYAEFWEAFGAVLKEGIYEDFERRATLLDLCRFQSSLKDGWIGLADYLAEMPEGQEHIYYLTGDSAEALKANPQIEGFTAKGVNVLLLTDAIDEFWTAMAPPYKDRKFASVGGAGADLARIKGAAADETAPEAEKPEDDKPRADIAALATMMKTALGDEVTEVKPSSRLTSSPVCLVSGDAGVSLHLERLLKAHNRTGAHAARVLEINPGHPVIAALARRAADGADIADAAWLLLDQARIVEGEPVADAAAFSRRLTAMMEKGLF